MQDTEKLWFLASSINCLCWSLVLSHLTKATVSEAILLLTQGHTLRKLPGAKGCSCFTYCSGQCVSQRDLENILQLTPYISEAGQLLLFIAFERQIYRDFTFIFNQSLGRKTTKASNITNQVPLAQVLKQLPI